MQRDIPYPLGRIEHKDERDFPMGLVLANNPNEWPKYSRRIWTTGPVFDQGHTNSCVGYSWKQFLQTTPLKTMDGPNPLDIYYQARLLDPWPQNDRVDSGTTVRAGAQVLQGLGRLKSYVFAQNITEIQQWVLRHGPLVVGVRWSMPMFTPDPSGLVHPSSDVVGGHAWVMHGVDRFLGLAYGISSWGLDFGVKGKFSISLSDLDALLMQGGEACAAVERKVVASN